MGSTTITTLTVPSYPFVGGEFLEAIAEFNQDPDFRQALTYRRFIFDQNDPITGDMNRSNSTDYTIYGDVQIATKEHKLVEAGYLNVGDGIIYLPARIQKDTDGNAIDFEFRPQIQDEIVESGVTYKIDKIEFTRYGHTEIFCMCLGKRRKDTNPPVIWNPNYSDQSSLDGFT